MGDDRFLATDLVGLLASLAERLNAGEQRMEKSAANPIKFMMQAAPRAASTNGSEPPPFADLAFAPWAGVQSNIPPRAMVRLALSVSKCFASAIAKHESTFEHITYTTTNARIKVK